MTTARQSAALTENDFVEDAGEDLELTVGQVAERFGVTVRTLHHYDEIGLLVPSERTPSGYRIYTRDDLTRLATIVVYRRLEFSLEEISLLLADPGSVQDHLRRQRAAVMSRLDELTGLVDAIDRALEHDMTDQKMTTADMKELFGDSFSDEYQQEAEQRWGETAAWKQSAGRTEKYTKADWQAIKAEGDAINAAFVAAKSAGEAADSVAAMDAAEAHRRHIHERFYDIGYDLHRGLADM